MAIVWDPDLPQCLEQGWSEVLPKTTIRTEMDAGPSKVRQRFTTKVGRLSGSIILTLTQVPILRTFYSDDIEGGALPFEWVHPLDHSARLFRFVEEPTITNLWRGGVRYCRAALALEMLPIAT